MTFKTWSLSALVAAVWLALFATTVGCVWAKHETRKRFVELRTLERERDRLEIEWGKLRIEQSTWATHGRVENLARDALDMRVPAAGEIAVLQP